MMVPTSEEIPHGALLVEQHYDRAAGRYFYTIMRGGMVASARQLQEARFLHHGNRTEVLRTRGGSVVPVVIENHHGQPRFRTRHGNPSFWEALAFRFSP